MRNYGLLGALFLAIGCGSSLPGGTGGTGGAGDCSSSAPPNGVCCHDHTSNATEPFTCTAEGWLCESDILAPSAEKCPGGTAGAGGVGGGGIGGGGGTGSAGSGGVGGGGGASPCSSSPYPSSVCCRNYVDGTTEPFICAGTSWHCQSEIVASSVDTCPGAAGGHAGAGGAGGGGAGGAGGLSGHSGT